MFLKSLYKCSFVPLNSDHLTTPFCRILIPAFALILSYSFAQAQSTFQVKGKILELNSASSLPGAACLVLNPTDSSLVKATQTNPDGTFQIPGLENGNYLFKIQYLGYKTRFRSFSIENQDAELGSIGMEESSVNLKEVNVEGKIPPVRQMGDTTQFNASGYKTNTDATTEDLLTKMPGVTTTDGKVSVQGEEVRKVLVDNKPFFGDDANTALKNLPAEVVDKIQVFDQVSDQSRFTGFNDGNTTKTINIITKAGMRNGNFGKAYIGAGSDERFKSGLTLNRFQGARRFTLIGQANNINEQNFSMSDLSGIMGSSGGGGRRGGGMPGGGGRNGGFNQASQDFFVNAKKGIVNTKAIGFNYSDNWGKKVEVSANYFFNQSRNEANQRTIRNYVVSRDSGQAYTENSNSIADNLNHRFNLRLDAKLDSNNSILYTPRFTYQHIQSTSNTLGANALLERPVNSTDNAYASNQKTFNLNNEVLVRHKFKKKGRTISLTSNLGNNGSWGNSTQNSDNRFFGLIDRTDTLRQRSDLNKMGWSIQNNLTYTEPIGTKSQISVTYAYNYSRSENEKLTYRTRANAGLPDSLDKSLSNKFKSTTPSQYAGLGYAFNGTKTNLNLNINFQQSILNNDRTFPTNYPINRTFQNVLPTFIWRYNFTDKKNFRLVYRTSANAPSIDQLQDVVNNSNPLQLSTGNSGLRQDFQQNLFFRYSSTRTSNNSSFFGLIAASNTRHYIGNSTIIARKDTIAEGVILNRGSQLTKPINLDGYYSVRSFLMYSLPVTKLKTNLNANANANFTRTPGKVNGRINYANSPSLGAGIGLTSNISKAVDFNLSYNTSYTSVENTLNKTQNNSYVNQTIGAKLNLVFFESLVFNTDYTQNIYTGLSQGFNSNFALLNMGVGYKFLKNKQAELRATVFDLLKQNTNISRTITETYSEDLRSNNLQRYFMLTFTYTLRAFKAAEGSTTPNFQPGTMPPGMRHPGGM